MKCDCYGYERWTKKEIIRNATARALAETNITVTVAGYSTTRDRRHEKGVMGMEVSCECKR